MERDGKKGMSSEIIAFFEYFGDHFFCTIKKSSIRVDTTSLRTGVQKL